MLPGPTHSVCYDAAVSFRLIIAIAAVSLAAVGGFLFLTRTPAPTPERPHSSHASPHKPSGRAPQADSAQPSAVVTPPARRPHASKTEPPPAAVPAEAAAPTLATLHITSDVPGAQVFLDHTFIGAAPITASDVRPGPHRLNVSATGYEGFADSIDVVPGPREIAVRFKEITLMAHIDVVHKHTFGSCKGTLSATPQGIRYDTSNTGDAFTSPLTDLVTFEMSYLEKNLKIKLKNGKLFNFTDPDGNADRLFVFLGDVSKVRDRLRKGE